jgi:CRISPR-associated protein Csm3
MNEIRMISRIVYRIKVEVQTGLHIGGTKESYGIGGVDAPVIKNPLNGRPIIPGSSIKGKLRSLMDLSGVTGKYGINVLFEGDEKGPTRGIFRDLVLADASAGMLEGHLGDGTYTEIKTEVSIDKMNGKTSGGLRFIERVPAGAVFEGEIIINFFDGDDTKAFQDALEEGFGLLALSYLGGSGTRGYGKVNIIIDSKETI